MSITASKLLYHHLISNVMKVVKVVLELSKLVGMHVICFNNSSFPTDGDVILVFEHIMPSVMLHFHFQRHPMKPLNLIKIVSFDTIPNMHLCSK